jgi:tRNA (guanine-N7-)-methyltransferase
MMRLRRRAGTKEALLNQPDLYVPDAPAYKGRWTQFFGNEQPLHVELGMGKGRFLSGMSGKHPEFNFIGIDMKEELLMQGSDKARAIWQEKAQCAPPNVALTLHNIEHILDLFAPQEVSRIYLNFSDPWPKRKHVRRRLTHPDFLQKYLQILKPNGEIHLKTDGEGLFEFSLNSFSELGFRLREITLDLHRDGAHPDHIMTEYEMKFFDKGNKIYRCEALVPARDC